MPGVESDLYSYRNGPEIPRYMLIYYKKEIEQRRELRKASGSRLDLRKLLDIPEGARVAGR